MRTHDCFQHSNWVSIALPHGSRECENPVQEKKQTKFDFKKEYLKQGEIKDSKRWKSLPGELCHWLEILEAKGSKDTNFSVSSGKQKNYFWVIDILPGSVVHFYSFGVSICRACAHCFTEGCTIRVKSGLSSLFSEEYFTASKSNHLGCFLFLNTLFTGSNSGRECRLAEFLWHQHPTARL